MGLLGSRYKPRIAGSQSVRYLDLKSAYKPYYIVASVEVGNTTTKCIITATNLEEGKSYLINKVVKMTRVVRPPKPGEEVFGKTLTGVELSTESVAELVRDTIIEACKGAGLSIEEDLHFVVRSTGVVAGFSSPDEVGKIVKALADGCLMAGVPPGRMTPALSANNILPKFKKYSNIEKVVFDGAVASVNPPQGATGVEIVANEMEGELALAGVKEGAQWAGVEIRNPAIAIDCGTTLDGRITNNELPYAKTIGNFCGFAGAIADEIVKGTGLVDGARGTALDVFDKIGLSKFALKFKKGVINEYSRKLLEYVIIERVPEGRDRYGSVPVSSSAAKEMGVTLIGCDVGENGDDFPYLREIGKEIHEKYGLNILSNVIDSVMAEIVVRLIKVADEHGLVVPESRIGITGRAAITGEKPTLILEGITALGILDKPHEQVAFVDDGLARGAAVMGRCMNSLGTPHNPLGGVVGGKCIMGMRMKLQGKIPSKTQRGGAGSGN
ncbi:MAG: methanogenesis marker 14 protein [Methermicoccaceae archaeon]